MSADWGDDVMADAVDSDSSDSGSDFEEVDISEEDMKTLAELEEQIEANPNLYDHHVQYIALLRKSKMKARLKSARQAMHNRFPLAEPLWLEWLADEEAAVQSPQDLEETERLYELAVQDYLSIAIWTKYLAFLVSRVEDVRKGTPGGKEKFRAVCERALAAGGLHLSQGSRLWQAYRQFEQQHSGTGNAEDPDSPARKLLLRQLQVPLLDGPETLKEWGEGTLPEGAKQGYQKAQAMVKSRLANEESVVDSKPADTELLAAYMAYIKLEETSNEPARVQCMYERALAKFPVTQLLWQQYAHYLEQHLNLAAVVGPVYSRAVRNCPWVGALWARSLRALERCKAPEEQQQAVFNSALAAGMESAEDYLEVSLARLDAVRRRGDAAALRELFQSSTDLMQAYFPEHVDRSLRLPSYWAQCELELAGDYAAAREVWEAALRTSLGTYAEAIAAYVAFETGAKHIREARSIFRKYHRRPLQEQGGAGLCEAWLRFEREHGSADDYFQALLKVEPVLLQASAAAATAAAAAQPPADAQPGGRKPALTKDQAKQLRQEKDPNFKGKTPAEPSKRRKGLGFQEGGDAKRQKKEQPSSSEPPAEAAKAGEAAAAKSMGPPSPKKMGPPPARPAQASSSQPAEAASQRKAYIKGIASHVSKAEVEALLAPCGALVDLSMPEDRNHERHRGFAYATFSSPDGLKAALSLDGAELGGQSISVAVAHVEVQEDQRTAFILNVSPSTSVEALQALMATCGRVASVRLPLDRDSGQPRGFAYVEFEGKEGLQRAVDMSGADLDGRNLKISVAAPSGGGGRGRGRGPGRGRGGRGDGR